MNKSIEALSKVNLQSQFQKKVEGSWEIQEKHKQLWKWNGVVSETVSFKNHVLEGYLKKQIESFKIFNVGVFPKRYFIVDFKYAKMTIQKSKRDVASAKVILFRDILQCYGLFWQGKLAKEWTFSFFLKTVQRDYVLIAATPMEK